MIIKSSKVYLDKLKSITLPSDIADKLKEHGWEHATEVFLVYNEETNKLEVVLPQQVLMALNNKVGNAEGRICTEPNTMVDRGGYYAIYR